jgi:hypothetical protein
LKKSLKKLQIVGGEGRIRGGREGGELSFQCLRPSTSLMAAGKKRVIHSAVACKQNEIFFPEKPLFPFFVMKIYIIAQWSNTQELPGNNLKSIPRNQKWKPQHYSDPNLHTFLSSKKPLH